MDTPSFPTENNENSPPTSGPFPVIPATPRPRPGVGILTPASTNNPPKAQESLPDKKKKPTYRNNYEVQPKTTSFVPYALNTPGRARQAAFAFEDVIQVKALEPLSKDAWADLAWGNGLLEGDEEPNDMQIEAANWIIQRKGDLCVYSPTGSGKSLVWSLPLVAQKHGTSLVIVPYTTLGSQGERRHINTTLECTFLHSKSYSQDDLSRIATGKGTRVVYICPELLETPIIAQVLHCRSFKAALSAIYVDEAHCAHEDSSWRPGYTRVHQLRQIIGFDIPLVCLSATLPSRYREPLKVNLGLKPDYHLINLGSYRPELSTVVACMEHDAQSFLDLRFILPWNATFFSVQRTVIYSDDLDLLTEMFHWFRARLSCMGLPLHLVDILHGGLSEEHQTLCEQDFREQSIRILLGSEKIGLGMDFAGVQYVVQYRCRNLTLVRWEQRRGRGARRPGETAVGVILVEKKMTAAEGQPSVDSPKYEDPALLDLIQGEGCHQARIDRWMENPSRPNQGPCQQCSHCNPFLRLNTQLTWIMVNPDDATSTNTAINTSTQTLRAPQGTKAETEKKVGEVFEELKKWRLEEWRANWMSEWPSYAASTIVPDRDLHEISRRARNISNLDDLRKITHILHWDALGEPLLVAIVAAADKIYGSRYTSISESAPRTITHRSSPVTAEAPLTRLLRLSFNPEDQLTLTSFDPGSAELRKRKAVSQPESSTRPRKK